MTRIRFKSGWTLAALLVALPGVASAQDDCVTEGNQYTRGAEIELTWASRRDDPQTKEERYARAIKKLVPALDETPPLPRAYLLAARSYVGLRDLAGADSMLTKLEAAAPACSEQIEEIRYNAWVPWYNRGLQQLQAGDNAAALESFDKANGIYRDARSLASAASIHQKMGDTDKAMDLYREALAAGGDEEMTRVSSINLAELLRESGKADEALEIYSQYSEQHPDDILGQLNYAIALMDAGQKEQAQQIFSDLLARNDLDFRQWTQVGIGLYRAQNFERAADAFAHAHEIQPLNKEVLENLANARYQSDDYAALIPLADTLVRRYPYERVNYNLLANAQRETGEQDTALSVLQKRDGLTFEFLRSQLVPGAEGAYSVEGQVMNRSAPADAEIEVPFEFLDKDGAVVTTENLALALPPQGEMAAFQLQVQSETPIVGFRYKMAEDVGS